MLSAARCGYVSALARKSVVQKWKIDAPGSAQVCGIESQAALEKECAAQVTPCSTANLINPAVFLMPSLSMMLRRCTSTVRTLILSRSALSGFE